MKIKKYILLFIILTNIGWAQICDSKLFTFSTPMDTKVSVSSLLKEITLHTCNVNISYDDEIARKKFNKLKISGVYVKNYTFKQVLDLLISNNNFFYEIKDNILHIAYVKTKTFNVDYIPSDRDGESSFTPSNSANSNSTDSSSSSTSTESTTSSDTNTVNSHYSFDFWSKLSESLNNILNSYKGEYEAPNAIIDKNTGLVTVTATKKQLEKIENYIKKINSRLHKQIMIDVRIYEVHLSKRNQTGINWDKLSISLPSASTPLRAANIAGSTSIFSQSLFNASGLLNFLATQGNVNSVSNPKLATLNNQKAIITVGKTIFYHLNNPNNDTNSSIPAYGQKFVGILLDITPEISDNDNIILRINPSVSDFLNQAQLEDKSRYLPPDTIDNKLSTVVRIKDGDTLVLGGLITNKDSLEENGVPILKEIPLIRYLFSSKSKISDKIELVFVVTPHIVRENKRITIKELGY